MNSIAKAYELYGYSEEKITDVDVEALAINLEIAQEYGLNAHFDKNLHVYQITRYGKDVVECANFIELTDSTLAIANFIYIGKQHLKVA